MVQDCAALLGVRQSQASVSFAVVSPKIQLGWPRSIKYTYSVSVNLAAHARPGSSLPAARLAPPTAPGIGPCPSAAASRVQCTPPRACAACHLLANDSSSVTKLAMCHLQRPPSMALQCQRHGRKLLPPSLGLAWSREQGYLMRSVCSRRRHPASAGAAARYPCPGLQHEQHIHAMSTGRYRGRALCRVLVHSF